LVTFCLIASLESNDGFNNFKEKTKPLKHRGTEDTEEFRKFYFSVDGKPTHFATLQQSKAEFSEPRTIEAAENGIE